MTPLKQVPPHLENNTYLRGTPGVFIDCSLSPLVLEDIDKYYTDSIEVNIMSRNMFVCWIVAISQHLVGDFADLLEHAVLSSEQLIPLHEQLHQVVVERLHRVAEAADDAAQLGRVLLHQRPQGNVAGADRLRAAARLELHDALNLKGIHVCISFCPPSVVKGGLGETEACSKKLVPWRWRW